MFSLLLGLSVMSVFVFNLLHPIWFVLNYRVSPKLFIRLLIRLILLLSRRKRRRGRLRGIELSRVVRRNIKILLHDALLLNDAGNSLKLLQCARRGSKLVNVLRNSNRKPRLSNVVKLRNFERKNKLEC